MGASHRRLDLEDVGEVTVARFIDKKILDETNIQVIGNQMFAIVEDDGCRKVLLDFSNVEYLSSAALGKLIVMDKKVKAAQGATENVLCAPRHSRSLQDNAARQTFLDLRFSRASP